MDARSSQKKAGLGQASAAFMHGYRCHICTSCHCRNRQASSKIKMSPMGFICQTQHSCFMSHPHNCTKITANSIIGGIVYQHSHCIGMLLNCLCHLFTAHSKRNSKSLIYFRIHINRNCSAQNQRIQHASVNIAGKNDLVSPLTGS